jgi:SAM-dependent methyltransferase
VGAFIFTRLDPHHFHSGKAFVEGPNKFATMSDLIGYAAKYRKESLIKEDEEFDPAEVEQVAHSPVLWMALRDSVKIGDEFRIFVHIRGHGPHLHHVRVKEFWVFRREPAAHYEYVPKEHPECQGVLVDGQMFSGHLTWKALQRAIEDARAHPPEEEVEESASQEEFDPTEVEAIADPLGEFARALHDHGFDLEHQRKAPYKNDPTISIWGKTWEDSSGKLAVTVGFQVGKFWSDAGNTRVESAYTETTWNTTPYPYRVHQMFYNAADLNAFLTALEQFIANEWKPGDWHTVGDTLEGFHGRYGRVIDHSQTESSDDTIRKQVLDTPAPSGDTTPVVKEQQFTSARTCLKQVPALHKWLIEKDLLNSGMTVMDLGGGKYDLATEALSKHGVTSMVFDPFNRPPEHNFVVLEKLSGGKADAVICSNTLNVIKERARRLQVVARAAEALKEGGTAYFSVYNRPEGKGRTGKDTWQEGRPIQSYLPEIKKCFEDVRVVKGFAVAKKPISEGVAKHLKEDFDQEEIEQVAVGGLDTDRSRLNQLLHMLQGDYPTITKPRILYKDVPGSTKELDVFIDFYYDDQRTSTWGLSNLVHNRLKSLGASFLSGVHLIDQLEREDDKPAWAKMAFVLKKDTKAPTNGWETLQEEP